MKKSFSPSVSQAADSVAAVASTPATERAGVATVDRANRAVAAVVGLTIFAIYRITMSPDLSFWDAGEFIAASHSLGIPHPPGTPLYVLMGRTFSLLFSGLLHVASPAQAVNLLSAIPSAIAAVFLYLCVVRVGKKIWNEGDQATFCFPAVIAGVTTALFAAFANTLWINSIESEVYAVSGMWAVFTAWLVLVWADSEPKDERLLVVIAYLLALNIGVHLATYLAALAILPFAFLFERRLAIPVSLAVVLVMAKDLQMFLLVVVLLILPTLQHAIVTPDYWRRYRGVLLGGHALAIVLAIWAVRGLEPGLFRQVLTLGTPLAAFLLPWYGVAPPKKLRNPFTDLGFLLTLVTALGFSCHLYLPIRSALDPAINEGQPDTWKTFWEVILRSQYRPVSVFERQASWVYQFDHMFWRYFREQWRPEFLWLLGIPGLLVHMKRERKTFVLFGLLFLWTSAALVLKMNFTDHEVRERDYFFAPGFFYFSVWMGLGLGWLAHLVVSGVDPHFRKLVAGATAAVCVLIAAVPIRGHWDTHDRRGNWIAYDYAYNMLVSLEPDAVLFTNGDNDTFPLWYLQEVKGFRKDVRVINLSLLNTPWYGEQLRNEEPKVPMSRTTEEIYDLRAFREPNGKVHLVKDQMAVDIVNTTYKQEMAGEEKRPVYFAVTVDDLMDLDKYLRLEGLVFRLYPDNLQRGVRETVNDQGDIVTEPLPAVVNEVDLETTRRNLEEIFQYRGLLDESGALDESVYRDDNEQKLITNYAAAWARMALAYRALGDMDEAIACLERAVKIAPHYDPIAGGLGGMYVEGDRLEEARAFYEERRRTHPEDVRVYIGLAYVAKKAEDHEEALRWYLEGLRVDPDAKDILAGLFQAYSELGRWAEAENVLVQWIQKHPTDESAKVILEDLRQQLRREGDPGGGAE